MTNFDIKTATPMMVQWHECRQKAKDALLLFRMGDFYEAFYDDAEALAKALDLTLTKRQEIPMSGIPHHAFQNYIDRLLMQGFKVAVAEQTEDPKKAKGLVKRDLVRIITPGTLIDSNLLKAQSANYIASISQLGSTYGVSFLDISTADFRACEYVSAAQLKESILRYKPSEIIVAEKFKDKNTSFIDEISKIYKATWTTLENWHYNLKVSLDTLLNQLKVQSLDGYGLKGQNAAIISCGSLLNYLTDRLCLSTKHIHQIKKIEEHNYLLLDHITLNHLEVVEPQSAQNKKNTLLYHIDHTKTAMGARLLKEWVLKPLICVKEISERQEAISDLLQKPYIINDLKSHLLRVADLERLMMRIATQFANAKDLITLKDSLKQCSHLNSAIKDLSAPYFQNCELKSFQEVIDLIEKALEEEPPIKLGEGKTFKLGYNKNLDEYISLSRSSRSWLANYQDDLRQETQIKTLKVGYNRVFGYYIEVSKGQAHLMPQSFQRRQTLTNNERFISEKLKEFESKVLSAEEKIAQIEFRLFEELRLQILKFEFLVMQAAKQIAQIDCALSLALLAASKHYVKPIVDEGSTLSIKQARHPILDQIDTFIPNDTFLDDQEQRLMLITGPNMAGKSTYIRQVALVVILAQMGSFVPAESAHIGVVDKIFSRIGASDDLARGQSTFMVEMAETANILNNLSQKSLVILDEIGRGTSTYDGIAIAQSTAEHLLNTNSKTLFATHYSELTELEEKNKGVKNYTVAVHENQGQVTFLYKIIPGSADKSYGIHVAELAGLPLKLILRAKEILAELEQHVPSQHPQKKQKQANQLSFLDMTPAKTHPIVEKLERIDPNHLTPMQALEIINQLKEEV